MAQTFPDCCHNMIYACISIYDYIYIYIYIYVYISTAPSQIIVTSSLRHSQKANPVTCIGGIPKSSWQADPTSSGFHLVAVAVAAGKVGFSMEPMVCLTTTY